MKILDTHPMGQTRGRAALTAQYTLRFLRQTAPFLILLGFIAFMYFFFPFRNRFQFDEDEGINLMKASLVAQGYPLYEQIWSDQPPLLTYLLAAAFRLFGAEANVARLLILMFSAVLLLACYLILRLIWGDLHALAGTFLIMILPTYMRLSVSVMVGLPSIAFAMLSLLAVVLWHQQRKPFWLVLSALAFSASVLIKLFTGYLLPVVLVGLLVGEYVRLGGKLRPRELLWPAGLWVVIFAAVTAGAILLWVGIGNLDQLYQSHLLGESIAQSEITTISYQLRASLPLLFLSLLGILFTIFDKKWLSLYLIAWMGSAYLLLSLHSPVWYHHVLLVTVPAAMLGGVAVGEAIMRLLRAWQGRSIIQLRSILPALALVTFAWALYKQVPVMLPELKVGANRTATPLRSVLYEDVFPHVERYAPLTRWMITDIPMFAFRFGLQVPPNLVVFSTKRLETGLITPEEILQYIEAYSPEQILLKKQIPGLGAYLKDRYRLIYTRRKLDLFVRDDLNLEGRHDP